MLAAPTLEWQRSMLVQRERHGGESALERAIHLIKRALREFMSYLRDDVTFVRAQTESNRAMVARKFTVRTENPNVPRLRRRGANATFRIVFQGSSSIGRSRITADSQSRIRFRRTGRAASAYVEAMSLAWRAPKTLAHFAHRRRAAGDETSGSCHVGNLADAPATCVGHQRS